MHACFNQTILDLDVQGMNTCQCKSCFAHYTRGCNTRPHENGCERIKKPNEPKNKHNKAQWTKIEIDLLLSIIMNSKNKFTTFNSLHKHCSSEMKTKTKMQIKSLVSNMSKSIQDNLQMHNNHETKLRTHKFIFGNDSIVKTKEDIACNKTINFVSPNPTATPTPPMPPLLNHTDVITTDIRTGTETYNEMLCDHNDVLTQDVTCASCVNNEESNNEHRMIENADKHACYNNADDEVYETDEELFPDEEGVQNGISINQDDDSDRSVLNDGEKTINMIEDACPSPDSEHDYKECTCA